MQTANSTELTLLMGCDTFAPDVNGAARFTERLCAGLHDRGVKVEILAPAPSKKDYGSRIEVVEGRELMVHRLPSHKLWGHEWIRFVMPWIARRQAKRILDDVNPGAVHIQSHILVGRGLAHEAKKRGTRIIATNHVMPENILDLKRIPGFIKKPLLRVLWMDADRVLKKAQAITTPTRKAANFLEANTTRTHVKPVSCGLDASQYTSKIGKKTENRIVFVGRLNQEKQVDTALRALAECDPSLEIKFDIVGGGDQRDNLMGLADELGISDSVIWHGRVSDEHLRETLSNASVFVIPSIAELQSIATLEAMASGLPVIAADAMALPHLVEVGKNGYLFTPGDSVQLSGYIDQVLRFGEKEYRAMQESSLEMVADHDLERTLKSFIALYRGEAN